MAALEPLAAATARVQEEVTQTVAVAGPSSSPPGEENTGSSALVTDSAGDLAPATPRAGDAGGVPTIVGIDLSLTCTGIAGDGWTRRVMSTGHKGDSLTMRHARLVRIVVDVLLAIQGANLAVLEGPSFGQQRQGGQHDRAGLWWLTVEALLVAGVAVVEVSPASIKKYATGKGNAGKDIVMREAARRFPWFEGGEDEADALIACAMGYDHAGSPLAAMPALNRSALSVVAWPPSNVL